MKLLVLISIVITLNSCNTQTKTKKHVDIKTQEQTRDTLDIATFNKNKKVNSYEFMGQDSIKYLQFGAIGRDIIEYRTPALPSLIKTFVKYNSKGYSIERGEMKLKSTAVYGETIFWKIKK